MIVVTKDGSKGVGKLVYERCNRNLAQGPDFDMMEFNLRHVLQHELPRHEFLSHFAFLNAALVEIGDEFHIITESHPSGVMKDLIERLQGLGSTQYFVYKPSDPIEAKRPRLP